MWAQIRRLKSRMFMIMTTRIDATNANSMVTLPSSRPAVRSRQGNVSTGVFRALRRIGGGPCSHHQGDAADIVGRQGDAGSGASPSFGYVAGTAYRDVIGNEKEARFSIARLVNGALELDTGVREISGP